MNYPTYGRRSNSGVHEPAKFLPRGKAMDALDFITAVLVVIVVIAALLFPIDGGRDDDEDK